ADVAYVGLLTPNGQPDPGFGLRGQVGMDDRLPSDSRGGRAVQLLVQPDGRIVYGVLGSSTDPGSGGGFRCGGLGRLNPHGSKDLSFGTGGVVATPVPTLGPATETINALGLALQPDGKLLVVEGPTGPSPRPGAVLESALLRYNANGTLDVTFGTAGIAPVR